MAFRSSIRVGIAQRLDARGDATHHNPDWLQCFIASTFYRLDALLIRQITADGLPTISKQTRVVPPESGHALLVRELRERAVMADKLHISVTLLIIELERRVFESVKI